MTLEKQKYSQTGRSVGMLFPALLFLVFLLCTLFTLLIGGRVYENIRARDDLAFRTDTALAYVTNKVRQADNSGFARIEDVDGSPVLILTTDNNRELPEGPADVYETWIYSLDGTLRELFTRKGSGLSIEDGLEIMECSGLSFSLDDTVSGEKLLTVALEDGESAKLLLRSSQKGGMRP